VAPSLRAAELAGSIAAKFAAELLLLTVVDEIDAQQEDLKRNLEREHDPDPPAVAVTEIAEDAIRSRADRIASEHGIYVACEVRTGAAAAQIITAAREHVPDQRNETPVSLREMSARARRLAREILDRQATRRLIEFAEELEARAATMELTLQPIPLQRSDADADPLRLSCSRAKAGKNRVISVVGFRPIRQLVVVKSNLQHSGSGLLMAHVLSQRSGFLRTYPPISGAPMCRHF
jgi:hypothetical protein